MKILTILFKCFVDHPMVTFKGHCILACNSAELVCQFVKPDLFLSKWGLLRSDLWLHSVDSIEKKWMLPWWLSLDHWASIGVRISETWALYFRRVGYWRYTRVLSWQLGVFWMRSNSFYFPEVRVIHYWVVDISPGSTLPLLKILSFATLK